MVLNRLFLSHSILGPGLEYPFLRVTCSSSLDCSVHHYVLHPFHCAPPLKGSDIVGLLELKWSYLKVTVGEVGTKTEGGGGKLGGKERGRGDPDFEFF